MGKSAKPELKQSRAVGEGLAQVLPTDGTPWYRQRHLVILNIYAIFLSLLAAANGYDGSLMNSLMTLSQWQEFMDHPTGAWLGFINAIQSRVHHTHGYL